MYTCERCGLWFKTAVTIRDGIGYRMAVCPECGSAEIRELRRCPICLGWTEDDVCPQCRVEIFEGLRSLLKGLGARTEHSQSAAADVIQEWLELQD